MVISLHCLLVIENLLVIDFVFMGILFDYLLVIENLLVIDFAIVSQKD